MVQEEYEILEDEVEFVGDALSVPVIVNRFEEEYKGASRDEEYIERIEMDGDVFDVECPIQFIYNDESPSDDYTGGNAIEFIAETVWDSQDVVDVETMEFRKDGELWIASFNASELEEYRG